MGLRLFGDWIKVELDPDDEMTSGGLIVKPSGAHETIMQTGKVVDHGPGLWAERGDKRVPIGVEKGEGIVFVKFVATGTQTAQAISQYVADDEALIRAGDVLLVYDRAEPPRFL